MPRHGGKGQLSWVVQVTYVCISCAAAGVAERCEAGLI